LVLTTEIEIEIGNIAKDVMNCQKCELWKSRKNPVVGNGSLTSSVMFIGEAPGYHEDMQGIPFVGRAGKLFDDLLNTIELKREDVYVCNILKCRPPQNRNPYDIEINSCTPYLDKQIAAIKPKVIGTLGNFASSYILNKFGLKVEKISKIHGTNFHVKNLLFDAMIIPLYHPAAAVYNPNMKDVLIDDFKTISTYLPKKN
jgi:DNA polymerase